jgi:hypothetical protein
LGEAVGSQDGVIWWTLLIYVAKRRVQRNGDRYLSYRDAGSAAKGAPFVKGATHRFFPAKRVLSGHIGFTTNTTHLGK